MPFPTDSIDDYFSQLGDEANMVVVVNEVPVEIKGILANYFDPQTPGIKTQVAIGTLKFICAKQDAENLTKGTEVTINSFLYLVQGRENREKITTINLKRHKE
jgi:hypothetical protein